MDSRQKMEILPCDRNGIIEYTRISCEIISSKCQMNLFLFEYFESRLILKGKNNTLIIVVYYRTAKSSMRKF